MKNHILVLASDVLRMSGWYIVFNIIFVIIQVTQKVFFRNVRLPIILRNKLVSSLISDWMLQVSGCARAQPEISLLDF